MCLDIPPGADDDMLVGAHIQDGWLLEERGANPVCWPTVCVIDLSASHFFVLDTPLSPTRW